MKAVVFDLDGTLLNTLQDLANAVNYALDQKGYTNRTVDEVRSFIGNGVAMLIRRCLPEGTPEDIYQDTLAIFRKRYLEHMNDCTVIYPGVLELLKELKKKGYKIGIASNKFNGAVKELAKEFFADLIDGARGEDEKNGVRRKPEPDIVKAALAEMGSSECDAVYVGDSNVDLETAINSKLPCICVSWGYRSREELFQYGATTVVDTVDELFKTIENHFKN